MAPRQARTRPGHLGAGRPGRPRRSQGDRDAPAKPLSVAQRHAEWAALLRADGPFIAIPVLTEAFPQGLDTVPADILAKLRLAWAEVREAPDLLTPAWDDLVLGDLLGYTPQILAEGGALPADLRTGPPAGGRLRPDAIAYGPDGQGGRAERLLIYRMPDGTPLTTASRDQPSAAEQAAELCRHRGTPLALLTNGALWVLVHAEPGEPATTAVFDADLWLEERDLLRGFASLLAARRVLPPPKNADGSHSTSLAALFARSAEAQAEITTTLGIQVRQAAELLVGELSRLDRETGGTLLGEVAPREVYRGTLTVMMRLVFLLYAEEQRLLPVSSDLYATAYSVTSLHHQLDAEQNLYGDEIGDRRAAAWPRLLATFAAVYEGCEYVDMRIPPYGGSLFDPARYPWLERLAVTDRVVHEILGALLILRRRGGAAERLSYKGLDVEQIGHVYEGLLEFSCLRVDEPYLGLIGKLEPELPLAQVEQAAEDGDFFDWLAKICDASLGALRKAMGAASEDLATLHAACDNDADLAQRVRPLRGLLRRDLRGLPTVFPAGSLIITQVGDRRATGTHYTPRKLAEEIVEHTLAPLCYSPGPADGAEPDDWRSAQPPTCSNSRCSTRRWAPARSSSRHAATSPSGMVEAWERDGYPDPVVAALGPDFNRDDAALEARRRVASRCLCGVDRDEAAVELGKLSLWLVTLAKDQPFSFLDHALRCGDSLVGLISESQVVAFHLDPETGRYNNARLSGAIDEIAGPIMTRVLELREDIEAEPVRDPQQAALAAGKLQEADDLTARLRDLADAVSAAALSTAGQPADAFDSRLNGIEGDAQRLLTQDGIESPLERAFRARLDAWLKGPRAEPIRPLHWALEFPEVMRRGGFDAIVSNPPFIGGQRLADPSATDFREYLKHEYRQEASQALLTCAPTSYLRDLSIAATGPDWHHRHKHDRPRGHPRSRPRSGSRYGSGRSTAPRSHSLGPGRLRWRCRCSGQDIQESRNSASSTGTPVSGITPSLDPQSRMPGNPHRLAANDRSVFQRLICPGDWASFLEPQMKRKTLIFEGPTQQRQSCSPYLNGEDLNSRRDCSASRWVINFRDWPIEQAQRVPWLLCPGTGPSKARYELKNNDRKATCILVAVQAADDLIFTSNRRP